MALTVQAPRKAFLAEALSLVTCWPHWFSSAFTPHTDVWNKGKRDGNYLNDISISDFHSGPTSTVCHLAPWL